MLWDRSQPLYEAGKYAEAADRARELLEASHAFAPALQRRLLREPRRRQEDAIEHLSLAIDEEQLRELAAGDSDFDPMREEPEFKELVG